MALRVKEQKRLVKPTELVKPVRRGWNPFKRSLIDENINGENYDNSSKKPIKPIPLSPDRHTAIGSGLGTVGGMGIYLFLRSWLNRVVDPATLNTIDTFIFHLGPVILALAGSFSGFFGGRILGKLKIENAITSLILDINENMNKADTLEKKMDAVVEGISKLGFKSRIYLFDGDRMTIECKAYSDDFSEEEMEKLQTKTREEGGLTFAVAEGKVGKEGEPVIVDLLRLDKLIREYSNASIENITSDEIEKIISKLQKNGKQKDIEMLELLKVSNLEIIYDLWKKGIKMRVLFPIVTDGMRVGVVSAHTHRRVGDRVIEQLRIVVDKLSETIGKVRAQEHEKELDGLTGAYNYKYLMRILEEEIKRAKTQKEYKLSLIMFDLDKFKKINDTYGHEVGNIVLKELVALLKKYTRDRLKERNRRLSDILARYGGEEFCIIVVGDGNPWDMCERIRRLVEGELVNKVREICREKSREKRRVKREREQEGGKWYDVTGLNIITISIGIAPYNNYGDKTDLISLADNALYRAKNNGRNGVYVWNDGELIPVEPLILKQAKEFANKLGETELAEKCEEALSSNDISKMREAIGKYMELKEKLHKKTLIF